MARLKVQGGPDTGRTIQLSEGVTMIGRAETNDIVVRETRVSRQHAVIRGQRDGYWIQDLSSSNGTFVNGQEVHAEGRRLRHGDRIGLGLGAPLHWWFDEPGATEAIERPSES